MKNSTWFIVWLIITMVIGVIFIGITELRDVNRIQQKTIDGLRKRNAEERDSLQLILKETKDSLKATFETIRIARKESIEARERSQKMIRNLQKIVYIKYESDSARLNAITKLYPTFKP